MSTRVVVKSGDDFCGACGEDITYGQKYCQECGEKLVYLSCFRSDDYGSKEACKECAHADLCKHRGVTELRVYQVDDAMFEELSEAVKYAADIEMRSNIKQIVDAFFYRGIDADDIIEGIIARRKHICECL